jgi:hypothetical protein
MGHCVSDFSQKLLAYVIVQNYTPAAAILMISAIRAILNFRGPSNPELYGNSRTASRDSQVSF